MLHKVNSKVSVELKDIQAIHIDLDKYVMIYWKGNNELKALSVECESLIEAEQLLAKLTNEYNKGN